MKLGGVIFALSFLIEWWWQTADVPGSVLRVDVCDWVRGTSVASEASLAGHAHPEQILAPHQNCQLSEYKRRPRHGAGKSISCLRLTLGV